MTKMSKKELIKAIKPRYLKASKKEKGKIFLNPILNKAPIEPKSFFPLKAETNLTITKPRVPMGIPKR